MGVRHGSLSRSCFLWTSLTAWEASYRFSWSWCCSQARFGQGCQPARDRPVPYSQLPRDLRTTHALRAQIQRLLSVEYPPRAPNPCTLGPGVAEAGRNPVGSRNSEHLETMGYYGRSR